MLYVLRKQGRLLTLLTAALLCYYLKDTLIFSWLEESVELTPWQVYVTQRIQRGDNLTSIAGYTGLQNKTKISHFILTKVEKTGSSTLAAIFARFILQRKLNVMTMTYGGHLDITKQRGHLPGWDIGPRRAEKAEVLIDHARYNQSFIDSHFVEDVKLITSVRDAVSWFQSAVHFWPQQVGSQSADGVLRKNLTYVPRSKLNDEYNGLKTIYHLSQLQWLGFDYNNRNQITEIQQYIDFIVPKYDIIILQDQFEASLVVLRRRFNWDYTDILHRNKEVSKYRQTTLSAKGRKLLLSAEVNLGEQMLYDAFKNAWWRQPEAESQDFWDEVEYFKSLNSDHNRRCKEIVRSRVPYTYNATKWHDEFTLTQNLCLWVDYSKEYLMEKVVRYTLDSKYRRS